MTFHSTYHALNFEKILKEFNYEVRLMPVPRQVSSSCGTAAEFQCEKKADILKICLDNHIEMDDIHRIENQKKNNWFVKLLNDKG